MPTRPRPSAVLCSAPNPSLATRSSGMSCLPPRTRKPRAVPCSVVLDPVGYDPDRSLTEIASHNTPPPRADGEYGSVGEARVADGRGIAGEGSRSAGSAGVLHRGESLQNSGRARPSLITLRISLFSRFNSLQGPTEFPVGVRREFVRKLLVQLAFLGQPGPATTDPDEIPCLFLCYQGIWGFQRRVRS